MKPIIGGTSIRWRRSAKSLPANSADQPAHQDSQSGRESIRGLHALDRALLDPRHQRAESRADFFDRVLLAFFEECVVLLVATLVFFDPALCKFSVLHFLERSLHPLLHAG